MVPHSPKPDPDSQPPFVAPMLASADTELPAGDDWSYEMKWDGVRAIAMVGADSVELRSRAGNNITLAYPELQALRSALDPTMAVLDGEIVAIDEHGRSNFGRLRSRMHLRDRTAVARTAPLVPVTFMIFDLLWFDGHRLTELPYAERRALLDRLGARGVAWDTPPSGLDGATAFSTSEQLGFEGVIAKRLDSKYESGRRSRSWRKLKHHRRQEFVIGGWVRGQGGRANRIGALLLGVYNADGALRYVGKVGTGFSDAELDQLAEDLAARPASSSPFIDRDIPRDGQFVEPELVAEVRFTEWTANQHLRHPAYLGRRNDRDPRDVRRE